MEEGGAPVIYELTAESAAGQRIDKYLSGQLADLSRSYLQKLLKDGGVEVNKKPVKSNYISFRREIRSVSRCRRQ